MPAFYLATAVLANATIGKSAACTRFAATARLATSAEQLPSLGANQVLCYIGVEMAVACDEDIP